MTAEEPAKPFVHDVSGLEAGLLEAVAKAAPLLEPESLCLLRRNPIADEECPEVSDVDIVSIWERPEECPERMTVEVPSGRVFVDILWVPVSKMLDPVDAASYKILVHLLLESETVWMRTPELINPIIENIKLNAYEKPVWERRLGQQLQFGDAAFQEARKNLDFPPAALFFLQTAHAYYLMALADCLKESTMGLVSRPMQKLRTMAGRTGSGLEPLIGANLHLGSDPSASVEALERVHRRVSARCSDRNPKGVSGRTQAHYVYSLSPLELEYRKAVANALIRRGDMANANFYIRFWAYSLSRCPVVLEDARLGRNPSFYVPFAGFRESLRVACPEIVEDMELILGGQVTKAEAEESVAGTVEFRRRVTDQILGRGLSPASRSVLAGAEGMES